MKLPWILPFLSCVVADSPEVYYNTFASKVFNYTENSGSLFGFSVSSVFSGPRYVKFSHPYGTTSCTEWNSMKALIPIISTGCSRLVVGAPLNKLTGDVFTCHLDDSGGCNAVEKTIVERYAEKDDYKYDKYWFGATVKGNDDFFVGCAPRLIDKTIGNDFNGVGTFGQCYTSDSETQVQNKLVYITETRNKPSLSNEDMMEQTIDSFGWSLDIMDSSNTILAGSPVLTSGMTYKRALNNLKQSAKYKYKKGSEYSERFNFGYSVASFQADSGHHYYAVGSTFGKGSVTYVQDEPDKQAGNTKQNKTRSLKNKKNAQKLINGVTGSMFGAVLCTARLSAPALLVGSPTCPEKDDYNVGSVYVYITSTSVETPHTLVKTIVGETKQSFFGSAIASLGDLNGDSQDEIAVSAPYEDDQGAVYIYSGAKLTEPGDTMVASAYQQKIKPSPFYRTFGYSLAAIRDYDDNGCNELAIGIPDSSAVVVLRCAAAITIDLEKPPSSLSKNLTVNLPVCFTAKFPEKPSIIQADVSMQIIIQHAFADATLRDGVQNGIVSTLSKTIKLIKEKEKYCEDITINLKDDGKYNKKIFYQLLATLIKDPMTDPNFEAAQVKLSEKSDHKLTGGIWIQECGTTICKPNLTIVTEFSEKSSYTLGSSDTIDVTATVTNAGDVAYDSCVSVIVTGAQAMATEECKVIESMYGQPLGVQCTPKQVLRKSGQWNAKVSVDTTPLTNLDENISINVTLYELCGVAIQHTSITTFNLHPDAESVEILGRTDEGLSTTVEMTKYEIESRKSFEHIYTISNTGNTNWKDVSISIHLDKYDFVTRSVMSNSATCELLNESSDSADYSCAVPTLAKHAGIDVKVLNQVVPDKLSDRIAKENLTVNSEIFLYLNGTTRNESVTSELKLVEGAVPIWIIITASILALIILVIVFFILRECGFLKRKNQEELKKAKMSVRRQTVRRSVMNRLSNDDQDVLVEADVTSAVESQGKMKKERRVVVEDP